MDKDQIEHIACSIEEIKNNRVERVTRFLKLVEKDGMNSHIEALGNELDGLKFDLQTLLNFMEAVS